MSLLADLNAIASKLGIAVETGVFTDTPPNEYLVLTPLVRKLLPKSTSLSKFSVRK